LIEIDPPYAVDLKEMKRLKEEDSKLEAYNEVDVDAYLDFLKKTMDHAIPLLKDTGWLIMWFAPEPWFEPVYQAIRAGGLTCTRIPGIWAKSRGQTMQPNYNLANTYEMFFYARKGKSMIAKPGTGNTFFEVPVNADDKIHPTERP